jgi:acrylyl-CoA reductase (NADPH)
MQYHGVVAACGLAGGPALSTSVFPFILRGVRLIGVDSVYHPAEHRPHVWARLARDLDRGLLAKLTTEIALDEVAKVAPDFLKGAVRGRVVVRMDG